MGSPMLPSPMKPMLAMSWSPPELSLSPRKSGKGNTHVPGTGPRRSMREPPPEPIRRRKNPLFTLWVETSAVHAHAAWAHRGR